MSHEIDIFGTSFNNGIEFDTRNGYFIALMPFDDLEFMLIFNGEKHFEKLTKKTVHTFDISDFFELREKYEEDPEVNTDITIRQFTHINKPIL